MFDKRCLIFDKMFDKRAAFNFQIVRIPSITSNIPSIIFYSLTMSELVRTARSTLSLKDFLSVAKNLLGQMINGSKQMFLKKIKKAFNKTFQKYHLMTLDIVGKIAAT